MVRCSRILIWYRDKYHSNKSISSPCTSPIKSQREIQGGALMAKSAHKPQMAANEVPALTREQMISEVRNLRAGKLFVGNMDFVDALLEAHDEMEAERDKALAAEAEQVF